MTSFPLVTGAVTSLDKRIGDRSLMIGLAEHTEQYQRGYARFTLGRGDASYSGNGMTCSLQIWRISPGRFCGTEILTQSFCEVTIDRLLGLSAGKE